jgi:hypothetical protein
VTVADPALLGGGSVPVGARRIETDNDLKDVIALMRLNYERVVARHGPPTVTARRL